MPLRTISGLQFPYGIAVEKKRQVIIVEHSSHCVSIYDQEGKKVQSFGSKGIAEGHFLFPRGVAITNNGHILVTDGHVCRLQKLTPDGCCIMSVGTKGSRPLQFHTPRGIAVHPTTGQIYVADTGNHRIQVINDNFTYSHAIGSCSKGTAPGQLNCPQDVALDAAGNVYVVSYYSHCVDVFTAAGKHLWQFLAAKDLVTLKLTQLSYTTSITIHNNDLVYVAEYHVQ